MIRPFRCYPLALILGIFWVLPPLEPAMAQRPAVQDSAPAANPADVESIDAIIAALYDVISGPAGERRDWNRMRSLFVPEARLIPTGGSPNGPVQVRMLSVEDYVNLAGPGLERDGFFEREIARTSERFGNIAHVWSTYESRRAPGDPEPFMRGINSIQLMNDGTRWWIVNVFWQGESPENPLPGEYLPGGR